MTQPIVPDDTQGSVLFPEYATLYDLVAREVEGLTEDQLDVTDDFVRYARPLIGEGWPAIQLDAGVQRFARIEPVLVETRLPSYVPLTHR